MTKTYFSNVTATKSENKRHYGLLFGCKTKLSLSLKTFDEIGVITRMDKIQGKLRNRESSYMLMVYTDNHSRDMFQMLNFKTHG
jgi:hypothetical protein